MSPSSNDEGRLTLRPGTTAGVCEDDDELRGILRRALEREGVTVKATSSGSEAVRVFGADPPDILLLDIGLPDADGRDVCQALRARGVTSPVLFLTARDAVPDRISGFHAGGDDYLTKPFVLAELIVRVEALLRRTGAAAPEEVSRTGVVLDPAGHAATYRGRSVTRRISRTRRSRRTRRCPVPSRKRRTTSSRRSRAGGRWARLRASST